jgi:hypothetical protein
MSGRRVREQGWRQGCFLPTELVAELAKECNCEGATHAVVISQDCDLTYDDLDVERYAEIIFLHNLDQVDPGFVDGKSSRVLHLGAQENGNKVWLEAQPWNRLRIERAKLTEISPAKNIAFRSGSLRILTQWLAERYTRTAFPDAFVNRILSIDKDLKKLLKANAKAFWRLLVGLETFHELPSGQDYEIECICVIYPDASRKKAMSAAQKLEGLLKKCAGVKLDFFEAVSADTAPITYMMRYRPWDVFNYLSHRALLNESTD